MQAYQGNYLSMFIHIMAIATAGAIGAVFRFGITVGVHRVLGREFPYGTLVVNTLGSLLIGYLYVLFFERLEVSEALRSAMLIGLLGSFTTFSTFSLETLHLIHDGSYMKASANIIFNVTLCLAGTWLGFILARQI